jgi:hypothetical protein
MLRSLRLPIPALLKFIGPDEIEADPGEARLHLDWLLGLSLYAALCLMLARILPATAPHANELFYLGVTLLFVPISFRIAAPRVARVERIALLLVLAETTFAMKVLDDPSGFALFDEFLHWRSATDLLAARQLFVPNDLLYVSPLYPGLELITTALIHLTGLTVFAAGILVIAVCRAVFITGLFTFYELVTGSARLAGIGGIVYMGSTVYVMFDAQFAYESPAVAFMAVIFMAEVALDAQRASLARTLAITTVLLAALAITHHITDYFTAAGLCALALLQLIRQRPNRLVPILFVAGFSVAVAVVWVNYIGNPTSGYLAPVLVEGAQQALALLSGHGPPRTLYAAVDGRSPVPRWLTVEGLGSVLVLSILLAAGFFTTCVAARGDPSRQADWGALLDLPRRRWQNSRLILVALLALLWPLSIFLHLTTAGWELGNRMNAFVFVGNGLVAAFAIARFWRRPGQRVRGAVAGAALAVIAAGGVINGWGSPAVRNAYHAEGDELAIEPMGIDAATWTRDQLGPDHRFAADRDNSVLLATYGSQRIASGSSADPTAADLFVSPELWQGLRDTIQEQRIDYIFVDMRLTTQPAWVGSFFGPGEPAGLGSAPLNPDPLLKWDRVAGVSRVFDDGWVRIYDVRALQNAP